MPRKATRPRYYASRAAYYVQIGGKQTHLASGSLCVKCAKGEEDGRFPKCSPCVKIREAADLRFAELRAAADLDTAEDDAIVNALANRYLAYVKENRRPATVKNAVNALTRFNAELGHMTVRALKPIHVQDWLDKQKQPRTVETPHGVRVRQWGRTSRRIALSVVAAMFSWGVRNGLVTRNPVARMESPKAVSRTKENLITPDEHTKMVERAERQFAPRWYGSKGAYYTVYRNHQYHLASGEKSPETYKRACERLDTLKTEKGIFHCFALVLRLLKHTGARPGELFNLTAERWHPELGAFIFPAEAEPEKVEGFTHKTARKGKERCVFISDEYLRSIIELLCQRYPTGPLLRNVRDGGWSAQTFYWRFKDARKACGISPKISPYSYRHASITDMVVAGHPPALVAECHGTSVEMIAKHYGHLDAHRSALADFWAKAKTTGAVATAKAEPLRVVG